MWTGIFILVLIGVMVLIHEGWRESTDITDNTPPTAPTKDAYDA